MGITEEGLVAQKVAIWEGMRAAKESGDDIGVSTPTTATLRDYIDYFLSKRGLFIVRRLGSLRCRHRRQSVSLW